MGFFSRIAAAVMSLVRGGADPRAPSMRRMMEDAFVAAGRGPRAPGTVCPGVYFRSSGKKRWKKARRLGR